MKRRKWNRKRYEHARQLSRLMVRFAELPHQPPSIVAQFWDLMKPLDQQHDPMDKTQDGYYWRGLRARLAAFKRAKHGGGDDEIPF